MPKKTTPEQTLFPGEQLETIAEYPTLYKFLPASASQAQTSSSRPIVVCIPGGWHLARIFYGGHEGSRPQDFLAYWLNRHGFHVLALSYPLETEPEIMETTASTFRIGDWGQQAATTTKRVLEEQALSTRSVILISWSMAGRMAVRFNISAKELGLDIQLFISFSATPGFSSIRPLPPGIVCSNAGYFQNPSHMELLCSQMVEMTELNGGRDIIPRDLLLKQYTGGAPINLIGMRLKYDGKATFVHDEVTHEEDTRVLDIANLPFISLIYPTSISDATHALTDKATWGFLLTYKLENMIDKAGLLNVKGTEKWEQLLDLIHQAPQRLCVAQTGNHYFFAGEENARSVAEKVVGLLAEAKALQHELFKLIH